MELTHAVAALQRFSGQDLGLSLWKMESALEGMTAGELAPILQQHDADHETLEGAALIKNIAGQINVVIHALGILLCLPQLLAVDERVQSLSLGAGNTGKQFDLETDRRVAEFKFISWQGGPEAIRQNSVFKDFFYLAELESPKSRHLYVLGTEHPLKFMTGRRAMSSVLSKNMKLHDDFIAKYPDCKVVRDYYIPRREIVRIEDISPFLRGLIDSPQV